ncbi:MAG: hypothetical protein HY372_00965 [Candidatus Andersenbacteria bacterium]|nr:hypothetical protein [Candidatus Andersenbacteria bacterium]
MTRPCVIAGGWLDSGERRNFLGRRWRARQPLSMSGWRSLIQRGRRWHRDEQWLFLVGLLVYGVYSVAWPLSAGRDFGTYVLYFYDFFSRPPVLPMLMLYRMPLTPMVFGGLLTAGGSILAELALGFGYALVIVAVYILGAAWSRRAGILSAAAVLAYPPFAALMHTAGSDSLFALGFVAWATLVRLSVRRSTVKVMVGHAIAVFALIMIRPLALVLLLFAAWPWLGDRPRAEKVRQSLAFIFTSAVLLIAWSTYNWWRLGDFTVARGGGIVLPLYRTYVLDRSIRPEMGPASRRLAQAVQRDLLTREPYRAAGTTLEAFLTAGATPMFFDLVGLSDRVFGWDDDYRVLRAAGLEAVVRQPRVYVWGLIRAWGEALLLPYEYEPPSRRLACGPVVSVSAAPGQTSHLWWLLTTPDQQISTVWGSPEQPHLAFRDSAVEQRYLLISSLSQGLLDMLPGRAAAASLGSFFNAAARGYPPMIVWFMLGSVGAVLAGWPRALPLLVPAIFGWLLFGVTLLGLPYVPQYRLPLDPLFISWGMVGACALTDRLRRGHT